MKSILWTQGRNNNGAICTSDGVVKSSDSRYHLLFQEFAQKDKVKKWDYDTKDLRMFSDLQMTIVSGLFTDVDDMGRRVAYSLVSDDNAAKVLEEFSYKLRYTVPHEHYELINKYIQKKKKAIRTLNYLIIVVLAIIAIAALVVILKNYFVYEF